MIPQTRQDVKSTLEWDMVAWLHEADKHGLIHEWEYEPESFLLLPAQTYKKRIKLKTKTKLVTRCLHRKASYTPDFRIDLTEHGIEMLEGSLYTIMTDGLHGRIWIDTKGGFNPEASYFSLVQKSMYSRHSLWVEKIVPYAAKLKKSLFKQTFAPRELRWMKKRKLPTLTAIGKACLPVEAFLLEERIWNYT